MNTVCLVGNGPSLLGLGLGGVIDSFDEVVRFNQFEVEGFEADTGRRTTLWHAYAAHSSGTLPAPRLLTMCSGFRPAGIEEVVEIPRAAYNAAQQLIKDRFGSIGTHPPRPTSGLVVLVYYLEIEKQPIVYVAGFDHFSKEKSGRHHYWKERRYGLPREHDGFVESEIFERYRKRGRLVYLTPPPRPSVRKLKQEFPVQRLAIRKRCAQELTVLCVLKSGGRYDAADVHNLRRLVEPCFSVPFRFVCLSDDKAAADLPLVNKLPGWWSKLELFKHTGPCIYLDLDTFACGSLDPLAEWAVSNPGKIAMLMRRARDNGLFGSGIMAWNGDFSWLLSSFDRRDLNKYGGDDVYLSHLFRMLEVRPAYIEDLISTRLYCGSTPPGKDDRLIYFANGPKPRDVGEPYWIAPPGCGGDGQ